jgi:hypothetical protein
VKLELSPEDLAGIARDLAPQLAELLQGATAPPSTPWMRTDEAIAHSRLGKSTFEKLAAEGRLHASGGTARAKLYHRAELDEQLRQLAECDYAAGPQSNRKVA